MIAHKEIDFSTINMQELVKDVASDYFIESKKNYDIYFCPFHSDNSHSAG